MKEVKKSVDPRLWHACAGGMIQMPLPNSKVAYFPQGHAEHTLADVDFSGLPRIPAFIFCRIVDVKFMADIETDEVYAKINLNPLGSNFDGYDHEDESTLVEANSGSDSSDKPSSFAKTLTQSDANNGGGFSVPRYCAETIFPCLDYSANPPAQTLLAKDVHGEIWKFRHIYRGTPRRHLLTTGWSRFVNQKRLVAGDSIVFMRAENGDLFVGVRRAKRGGIGVPDIPSMSGNSAFPYGGVSSFLRENENKLMRNGRNVNPIETRKVRPEAVLEATFLAAKGQPFEVTYYPHASTPEFCVKVSSLTVALHVQWCAGMSFKMAFETEDSSRISWFLGTVSSVRVVDPFLWPNSPWRMLQVIWDEPYHLQNVKCVSPWVVELVSNMQQIHFSSFSPHRKKLRLPQPSELYQDDFILPSFTGKPHMPSSQFRRLSDNVPAGIQGARHARFKIPLPDLNLTRKLQLGRFPSSKDPEDDISCQRTIGTSSLNLNKDNHKVKAPMFLLFGQPIHLEQQQTSNDCFSDECSLAPVGNHSSDENANGNLWAQVLQKDGHRLDSPHCEVFLGSEDMGRALDLSDIGSFEELHRILTNWFGIEWFNDLTYVLYEDLTGTVKRIGDESFSEFVMKAKRLSILMGACGHDNQRKPMTGLGTAGHRIGSSKHTGATRKGTLMQLVAANMLKLNNKQDDFAGQSGSICQKFAAAGRPDFFFIVNMQGPWIVKQSVGNRPCLLGQILKIQYVRGKNYLELDIDVGSSMIAKKVANRVLNSFSNLILEAAFLIQGNTTEGLPEHLLATCHMSHIDI